jgi:hypothetical protein
MTEIYTDDTKAIIKAKSSFSECTSDEIQAILTRRYLTQQGKFTELQFKISLVTLLVENMTEKKFMKLEDEEKIRYFNRIRWATTETVKSRPFDVLKIKNKKFIFPEENYTNTNSLEFAMANIFYLQFTNQEKPNAMALYDLMAIFIRPRSEKFWDWKREKIREEYDSKKADETAKFLRENMPFGMTIAFLQWFEFTNNNFLERNRELLEGGSGRPLFYNGEGWIAMLEDIAESRVHGDFDQVCQKPVHTIFMYLRHTKTKLDRQIEEQEAAMEFVPE